jgi:hydrogenase/urease accessory protein HupE
VRERFYQKTSRFILPASLALLLCPVQAEAHLVTTGLGPFYDGIGHLALSPEDWVPVLALALFAGLRGPEAGRYTLFLLPVAWLAGGLVGLLVQAPPAFGVPAISFLIPGALVAADLRMKPGAVAALAMILGFIHGWLNGAAVRSTDSGTLELVGMISSLFVVVALVAALVVSLTRPWTRIAVRVAGSWIAATGLLLLGWSLHRAPL